MRKVSLDDILNKAYRLAYFLHPDKATAKGITLAAVLKLDVAMTVQSKRLYYIPMGRFLRGESRRVGGIRNKAIFSDVHLLQRLIYSESEPYERRRELAASAAEPTARLGGRPLNDEDLLVYFVKHLVRITIKRNAFYSTLGVSRLMHNYSTVEAMDIYNAVIGEPERVKDDYYYRSRKGVLMQELRERFGHLLRVCRRQRGEERFETQHCSSEHRTLVRECLALFTPWNTRCPVPAEFDPLKTVIAHRTEGGHADESQAEVGRIHSVLHPDCFEKLVAGLGHDPPGQRLEIPRFLYQQAEEPPPPRQRSAPNMNLNAEELADIHNALAEQAGRRQTMPAALMRIVVDGVERATLNPAHGSSVSFSADESAEVIEVRTTAPTGDLLLATHLLDAHECADGARPQTSSIRLEGGQELSLSIGRRENAATGAAEWLVDFSYRETSLRRAASLFLHGLGRLDGVAHTRAPLGLKLPSGLTLACGAALVCALAYLGYLVLRPDPSQAPAQALNKAAPPERSVLAQESGATGGSANGTTDEKRALPIPSAKPAGTTPAAKDRRMIRPAPAQGRAAAEEQTVAGTSRKGHDARDDAARVGAGAESELTRSGDQRPKGVALGEVRKVYLELSGDGPLDELRRRLSVELNSSGLVIAAANTDEADAALKVSVALTRLSVKHPPSAAPLEEVETRVEVSVRLVNAVGEVLWPGAGRGGRYAGVAAQVAPGVVEELLAEIRGARSGHKRR